MTNYIGPDGRHYDSKAEAAASRRFRQLGCIPTDAAFPHTFTDAEGKEFRAKPDFFHPASGLFIEHKSAPLNSRTTKSIADRAIASKQAFKGTLSTWDWLCDGWNHSKHKHAIVQRELSPQNFVVVFDQAPTAKEAMAYKKGGLVFIAMTALPSYLLYARLAKAGIKAGFLLRYRASDTEQSVLALGPYEPAGWLHRAELA